MPKTKKQTYSNKLLTSISLNSTKGKLIVFLLAFAVVGGGIMVYKSFAASYEYVDSSPTLVAFRNDLSVQVPSTIYDTSDTYQSKQGTYYIKLVKGHQGGGMYDTNAQSAAGSVYAHNNQDRVCATVKIPSGDANVQIQQINDGSLKNYSLNGSLYRNYNNFCTPWENINRSRPRLTPGLLLNNGSPVYLEAIHLQAN